MCNGGMSTAEKYKKFGAGEYSSSDFERYVDGDAGLSSSWRKIQENPNAWDSQYWIKKGATSKSAFGRAHAAEDAALYSGSYGDRGDTKIIKGTPEYDAYFGKYGGGTRFDAFKRGDQSGGSGESAPLAAPTIASPIASPIQEAAESNIYFPMRVPEYTTPQALDYSNYMPSDSPFGGDGGLLYQPWSQDYMDAYPLADNILSYQPPELGLPQVTYSNPIALALIEYAMGGSEGGGNEEPEDDDNDGLNDPEGGGGDGGGVNGGYGGNASGADVGNSGMGGYGGTGPASKGGSGKGKSSGIAGNAGMSI